MPLTRRELDAQLPALLPALQRFAVGLAGSREGSEDLAQEAVLRAMRHHASVRDPKKLLPWLKSIIRNEHRNRRRDRRRQLDFTPEHTGRVTWDNAADLLDAIAEFMMTTPARFADGRNYLCLVTHYVLGWKATEAAALLRMKANTVQRRLQECRKSMARAAGWPVAPVSAGMIRGVQCDMTAVMFRAAAFPMHGDALRNHRLIADTVAYCRELAKRYPDDWLALRNAAMILFNAGQAAEYATDKTPYRLVHEWKRELWNRALLAEADALVQRLRRAACPAHVLQYSSYQWELFMPERHADVNWQRCLALCRQLENSFPQSEIMLDTAMCIFVLRGPDAALAHLKSRASHPSLRNNRRLYLSLANLSFQAGRWMQARKMYRRYLRWPIGPGTRDVVSRRIQECDRRLSGERKR